MVHEAPTSCVFPTYLCVPNLPVYRALPMIPRAVDDQSGKCYVKILCNSEIRDDPCSVQIPK